jgi:hypothetical protein
VSCDHNVWHKIDALRTIVCDVLATPTHQDGEGASSAAAAQRLVMMGGRLAWQLRAWVAELGTSGGYNTLMEVGGWGFGCSTTVMSTHQGYTTWQGCKQSVQDPRSQHACWSPSLWCCVLPTHLPPPPFTAQVARREVELGLGVSRLASQDFCRWGRG